MDKKVLLKIEGLLFRVAAGLAVIALSYMLPGNSLASGRTLFILLDAVPYAVVADLTDPSRGDSALFRDLKGPVPLVSAFPSGTNLAMPGMLGPFGLKRSPGYQPRFFVWRLGKARGGGLISYHSHKFPWRTFFDWNLKGPFRHSVDALHPVGASIRRLDKAIDKFIEVEKKTYWIYVGATDMAGHLKSPESLKEVFIALDAKLREVRAGHPDKPFEVVIFSDHGMAGGEPLKNIMAPVKKALKKSGYCRSKKLRGPKDVVLLPYGLLFNMEAYTHEEIRPDVAKVLAGVPGVDHCCFSSSENCWTIESPRGTAIFCHRSISGESYWSYEPINGDPLNYLPLIPGGKRPVVDGPHCFPDSLWFETTAVSEFPDAFYRLSQAFELVENPASIACSLSLDSMYGARFTVAASRILGRRLCWTHGSLHKDSTIGFLMSDVASWDPPRVVRFDQAFLPFVQAVRENDPLWSRNN